MKKLLVCLLVVGFSVASTAYGGSPQGFKPYEEQKPPKLNSAAMEGLMLFEAAENDYMDMMGEIIPEEPTKESEKEIQQTQEEKDKTGEEK